MSNNHPIEIAIAIAVGGIVMIAAWLITNGSTLELEESAPVEITEAPHIPRASMAMTHKELRQMAQDQKVGTGKWRSRATKAQFVRALQQEVN